MNYQNLITVRAECFLDTPLFPWAGRLSRTKPGKYRGRSPWPFFVALLMVVAFSSGYLAHRDASYPSFSSVTNHSHNSLARNGFFKHRGAP